MRKLQKKYLFPGIVLLTILVLSFPAHKWSRTHVNYYTGTEDHPLNCLSCHLYLRRNSFSKFLEADYYSPINLVSGKNKVYVVAQDRGELLETDPQSGKVLRNVKTGMHPHSAITDNEGKLCYISNQWSDNISIVDLGTFTVIDTLQTGNGPAGIEIDKAGRYLYAVNSFGGDISVIDLKNRTEIKRLPAGNNPVGISMSPDGNTAYVTSRRALISPYGSPVVSEITVLDASTQQVAEHKNIESAYLMENIAFTPSGDMAIFTMIRPKNLVPSIQVERGFMMTFGIGIIDRNNNNVIQLLIDEPNSFYPDPFDIAITPDGKKAFVTSSGVDCISVLSLDSIRKIISQTPAGALNRYQNNLGISHRFVLKRIHTGANPKGIDISQDGKYLYVAEMLNDRILIIDTDNLEEINDIDLGGPARVTVTRHGRRLMNNAGHTFQNQFSCYTCHPDTHEDGLVYNMASKDMGRNVTNTQSLRNISHTAPFKWNGKNQSVYKQDGIRFSTVLTRTEPFTYKELDAISGYILSGIPNAPNLMYNPDSKLTPAQAKGKVIFERTYDSKGNEIPAINRCVTCHPAPFYTNREMLDVGTLAATDDSILFDVPHLNNIFLSPPYLHDGRASTLEEIWTLYGTTEQHGAVNDLTKTQLNELIEYLKSLKDPEYEEKSTFINKASFLRRKQN